MNRATDGKPELLKAFQDATAVVDSSRLCVFTTFAWTLHDIQPQIQAACPGDWSLESLLAMGERIWNLERDFNLAAGITSKDDTLPLHLLTEPCKTGASKGMVAETTLGLISASFGQWQGVAGGESAQLLDESGFRYLRLASGVWRLASGV